MEIKNWKKINCHRNLKKMLISTIKLETGKVFSHKFFLFQNLNWALFCKKCHFVEYTTKKCLKSFAHTSVDAQKKQTDENAKSSVVPETMKLLANSS